MTFPLDAFCLQSVASSGAKREGLHAASIMMRYNRQAIGNVRCGHK